MRLPRDITSYGPTALLLNWEQQIDQSINESVHIYASAIREIAGVMECIPAYCSLMVTFAPQQINAFTLRERIYDLPLEESRKTIGAGKKVIHQVPVVYGGEHGPDLAAVATATGLTTKRVIQLHSKAIYRVYQLGYQPGFGFLGLTDERIAVPRLATPRSRVPAGSIGLAGRQTGIYPHEAPGGWQLIGQTPLTMWDNGTGRKSRFQAGDEVQFYAIKAKDWEKEKAAAWPK